MQGRDSIRRARRRRRRIRITSAFLTLTTGASMLVTGANPLAASATAKVSASQVILHDGTPTWDATNGGGNDVDDHNGWVRTLDLVTYQVTVANSAAGGNAVGNATVTSTLPVGMAWAGLDGTCLGALAVPTPIPVSSISADRRTITCNLGPQSASLLLTLPLLAYPLTTVPNGTNKSVRFDVSYDDTAGRVTVATNTTTVKVSAGKALDLSHDDSPSPVSGQLYLPNQYVVSGRSDLAGNISDTGTGLAGATVSLLDVNDNPIINPATSLPYVTTTDGAGHYTFLDLLPGTIKVAVTAGAPSGKFAAGSASLVLVAQGQALVADVNYVMPIATTGNATISGNIFSDIDFNKIKNAGDPGVDNITLTLTGYDSSANPLTQTVTTDANGNYSFSVPASDAAGYRIVPSGRAVPYYLAEVSTEYRMHVVAGEIKTLDVPWTTDTSMGRGYVTYFPTAIKAGIDGKGSQAINGDFGFVDAVPATAELYSWGANGGCGIQGVGVNNLPLPNGQGGGLKATPYSGTWVCSQSAPGANISVAVKGADTSGISFPSQGANGASLLATDRYLVTGWVAAYTPDAGCGVSAPDTSVTASGFTGIDVAGHTITDDTAATNYRLQHSPAGGRPCPGPPGIGSGLSVNKHYTTSEQSGWAKLPNYEPYGSVAPIHSGLWSDSYYGVSLNNQTDTAQNGFVPGVRPFGQYFSVWNNNGIYDLNDVIVCDKFDATRYTLVNRVGITPTTPFTIELTNPNINRALVQSNSTASYAASNSISGAYIIEYGVGTPFASLSAQQTTSCTSAAIAWTAWDPTTPIASATLGTIIAVRVRAKALQPGDLIRVREETKRVASPATTTYAGIVFGTPPSPDITLSNSVTGSATDRDGGAITDCYRSGCNLTRYADPGLGIVRINKRDPYSAGTTATTVGQPVNFTLDISANSVFPYPNQTIEQVQVVDTLPKGLTYQPNSATPAPTSVMPNANGTTTITWDMGDIPADVSLTPITYVANVDLDVPNGSTVRNSSTISSPDDPSLVALRTSVWDVTVSTPQVFKIFKSTPDSVVEPTDAFEFDLKYKDLSPTSSTDQDFIDVLPFNPDSRGTDFAGNFLLNPSITPQIQPAFSDDVVYVTLTAAASVDNDPLVASNDFSNGVGRTKWCQVGVDLPAPGTSTPVAIAGCPASEGASTVTALRVKSSHAMTNTDPTRVIKVYARGNGDVYTNKFANNFGATAQGFTGSTDSNVVVITVTQSSIGDRVWQDQNANGVQDAGEPGIPGVRVKLTGKSYEWDGTNYVVKVDYDATPMYAVTDVNGNYSFGNLNHGDYRVTFPTTLTGVDYTGPGGTAGYTLTKPNAGLDTTDSDADKTTGDTVQFCLGATNGQPGQPGRPLTGAGSTGACSSFAGLVKDQTKWDAGYTDKAKLGNFVWSDSNGNGVQNTGEPGIDGVTVNLLDPGADGVYNTGDETIVATTVTGDNPATPAVELGWYEFDNLVPGQYQIQVITPSGYVVTRKNATSDNLDSDLDPNTHVIDAVAKTNSDTEAANFSFDAGFTKTVSFGNFVWADSNADGTQDAGEPGMDGVTVALLDANGNAVLDSNGRAVTTVTGDDPNTGGVQHGYYHFDNLLPGSYKIRVIPPFGYSVSPQGTSGANGYGSATDSDANGLGVASIILTSNTTVIDDLDVGLFKPSAIGDRVFFDTNNNGVQDAGEVGVAGVGVHLLDQSSNPVNGPSGSAYVVTTDSAGRYLFSGLLPKPNTDATKWYRVTFDLPSGYKWSGTGAFTAPNVTTTPAAGSAGALDTDSGWATRTQSSAQSGKIWVTQSETNDSIDAGMYRPGSIGDYVWVDANDNGVQDPSESGFAGVTVTLLDSTGSQAHDDDGNLVAPQTTGASGAYLFSNLAGGNYKVRFDAPSGTHYAVARNNTGTTATDNDAVATATPLRSQTSTFALANGQARTDIDAGYVPTAGIGNFVWHDQNGDGIQNVGEPGLAGADVTLETRTGYGADGLPDTADDVWTQVTTDGLGNVYGTAGVITTSSSGAYMFDDLAPGTYRVLVKKPATGTWYVSPQGDPASVTSAGNDSDTGTANGSGTSTMPSIDLAPGDRVTSADAGYFQPVSIGNFIWVDANGNGVQDGGETGVAGAQVQLWRFIGIGPDLTPGTADDYVQETNDVTGAAYGTAGTITTPANGAYLFANARPGTFQIRVVTPSGYVISAQDVGSGGSPDTNDSDLNGVGTTSGVSPNYTIQSGNSDLTVDGGVFVPASLGDRMWVDTNGNGVQDAGEPGLGGVTVTLDGTTGSGGAVHLTTTSSSVAGSLGAYSFANLAPGSYHITTSLPSGYSSSPTGAGTASTDSDTNPSTHVSGNVLLATGDNYVDLDAGFFQAATIGNFVWDDLNANGVQDAGEPGLAGATVQIEKFVGGSWVTSFTGANGSAYTTTTTTNSSGAYSFSGLRLGDYRIKFTRPTGFAFTTLSATSAADGSGADNDAQFTLITDATAYTSPVTLTANENETRVDAGFFKPASLGDRVWEDTNGNGRQDTGEPNVSGALVELLDGSNNLVTTDVYGNAVSSVTTTASGAYSFTNMRPGTYKVRVTPPAGYVATLQAASVATNATDSDIDFVNHRTNAIVLISKDALTTVDAGLYRPVTLGDRIWHDTNANGQQDGGEGAITGATVTLWTAGVDSTFGTADDVQVTADIDGTTFGIAGTITTTNTGLYSFANLRPNSYEVRVAAPSGYVLSAHDIGADTTDSDMLGSATTTGRSGSYTLVSGETNNTIDAGMYQPAALGNFVWIDTNGDGVQDAGELGLSGVTVTLDGTDNAGQTVHLTTTTSSTAGSIGAYSFTGLAPGSYHITMTLPTGYSHSPTGAGTGSTDSDINVLTHISPTLVLAEADVNNDLDAGLFRAPSIGDRVWRDVNGNGTQDVGDNGISGASVFIERNVSGTWTNSFVGANGSSYVTTATTDSNGNYLFSGLRPGDYRITFIRPSGLAYTTKSVVAADASATDSDALFALLSSATATSSSVNVTDNENEVRVDAGFYTPASIGDFVWIDTNGNGAQDAGETGLAGATIDLLDNAGNPITIDAFGTTITSIVTTSSGAYSFPNLRPGTYKIKVTPPAGYTTTLQAAGANGVDSDIDFTTHTSGGVTLADGSAVTTVDAGFYLPASIGNFAWHDTNANGIQDAGEPGLAGATVTLWTRGVDGLFGTVDDVQITTDVSGTTFGTAGAITTPSNGAYAFTNLRPNVYEVRVIAPATYVLSSRNQGSGASQDANDSDMTGSTTTTGVSGAYTLVSGQTDNSVDAGMYRPASLGDFVWVDTNGNGVQDTGEVGLGGVTVTLDGTDNTGAAVHLTTTTSSVAGTLGAYGFSALVPGDYHITVVAPLGYSHSPTGNGTTSTDSDVNVLTDVSSTVTLADNDANTTIDVGLFRAASIGDKVWDDLNANGTQDAGEPGLAGVSVKIERFVSGGWTSTFLGANGSAYAATSSTNGSGLYAFSGLRPGDYHIIFTRPSGTAFTVKSSVASDASGTDSDGIFVTTTDATATSGTVTLSDNETENRVDAGVFTPVSIGDFVWVDTNGDGIQNGGETGLTGATVDLLDNAGNPVTIDASGATITSFVTTSTGAYSFPNLIPGTYKMRVTPPAGYTTSPQNVGAATTDSDIDFTTHLSGSITLASGGSDITLDAGFYQPVSIGNFVWNDVNGDGLVGAGDVGVAGASVTLWRGGVQVTTDVDGVAFGTAGTITTPSNGAYLFSNLRPGPYEVRFTAPSGYVISPSKVGSNDAIDSDGVRTSSTTATAAIRTLSSGTSELRVDAGVYMPVSIGNFVWEDTNGNGIQDSGETGLTGVTVNLEIFNGTLWVIPTVGADGTAVTGITSTGSGGAYAFTNLIPGTYRVTFVQPSGYTLTDPNAGTDDTIDSDAALATGVTASTTLTSGQTDNSIDAGLFRRVSIGDRVWDDKNADGSQDAGEIGIAGVNVELLSPGPDGIWGNGDDAITASTTTDASGNYLFTRFDTDQSLVTARPLISGTYKVRFTKPTGYFVTTPTAAAPDAANSDSDALNSGNINAATFTTAAFVVASNQSQLNIDAGFFRPATLGNFAWNDLNANGVQDSGEPGLTNMAVTLWQPGPDGLFNTVDDVQSKVDGLGNAFAAPPGGAYNAATGIMTTGATGAYTFGVLRPGAYQVRFDSPSGTVMTRDNVAIANEPNVTEANDSDAVREAGNPNRGRSIPVTLITGQNNSDVDAGAYRPATIGNFVWEDLNGNGIQDAGEFGIANVAVTIERLLPGADGVMGTGDDVWSTTFPGANGSAYPSSQLTLADGSYNFAGLEPGQYRLAFSASSIWGHTRQNATGSTVANDSDADPITNYTAGTTLISGETDSTWDAGFVRMPAISGYVYHDKNNDGVRQSGEAGIPGSTVQLTGNDTFGTAISITVLTDQDGYYLFTGYTTVGGFVRLSPSDPAGYTITETQPVGYLDGKDSVGTTGGTLTNDVMSHVVLVSSSDSRNNNFGEIVAGVISGTVYVDNTDDGLIQPGEPLLAGVAVTLDGINDLGAVIHLTATTAANGSYSFGNLRPGTYGVTEGVVVGYNDGKDTAGSLGGSTAVNDVISGIVIPSGGISVANNFGERPLNAPALTTMSGNVWMDPNRDGVRQGTENTGIAGVTVTLSDATGNVIGTTTTDANGQYSFAGIPTGSYIITETQPNGYLSTSPNAIGSVSTPLAVPAAGLVNQDFFEDLGSISGHVYVDTIDNGVRDIAEPGIGMVQVDLRDSHGTVVATTHTSADGSYSFTGLFADTYSVTEHQPSGWVDDLETAGTVVGSTVGSAGSDVITAIAIAVGDRGIDYNFGEQPPAVATGKTWVSGHVYVDANANSTLDGGESGLAGVTISLQDSTGHIVATVTTADGSYYFGNLDPGNYTIFETQPAGYTSTETPTNQRAVVIPIEGLANQNFGEVLPDGAGANTTLSGSVWLDRNTDGVINLGEPGIAGVTITLTDVNGHVVAITVTGVGGAYVFTNLVPGTYSITETQPAGYGNSAGTTATVIGTAVVPLAGLANQNLGETLSSLSGHVYEDTINNGVRDNTEPGIGGVTIVLTGTDINGVPLSISTTTDATGAYHFNDLLAPDSSGYTISETQPSGYSDDLDTVGSLGGSGFVNDVVSTIVFPATSAGIDYNFGEQPKVIPTPAGTVWITGQVYVDQNRNGVLEPGDTSLAGVTINIKDSTGTIVGTTHTGADGRYQFIGLTPGGTYTVDEIQPVGYGSSQQSSNAYGITAPIVPDTGQGGFDFGETLSSISGRVYHDTNNDGIRQSTEPGIGGVVVSLTGVADDGTSILLTATTGPDGTYQFVTLLAGTYTAAETQPAGWADGLDTLVISSSPASDTSTNDHHSAIKLPAGVDAPGYYFGEIKSSPVTTFIDGRVFVDRGVDGATSNGTYDVGEPPLGGVTIVLKDANGNVVATTSTLVDGTYRFDGIAPGDYTVVELQPAGYGSTTPNTLSVSVPLEGKHNVNYGENRGAVYGTVYADVNSNGIQDPGEPGIAGVTITLTGKDDLGNAVARTTVTDANGHFLITDLAPSNPAGYNIAETQPPIWLDGKDTSSKNGVITNDLVSGVIIAAGDKKETGNYGEVMPASIGDFIWNDLNGNGIQDAGEPGLVGVVIVLTGTDDLGNTVDLVTTSDANGHYIFTGLRPGSYKLTMSKAGTKPTYATSGTNIEKDSDFAEVCSCVQVFVKGNTSPTDTSANRTDIDGGVYIPVTITGTAPPGSTVTVTPKDPNNHGGPITVSVGPDGTYVVDGLRPGVYEVKDSKGGKTDVIVISGAVSVTANLPRQLATTGANSNRHLTVGGGLVVLGFLMLAVPKAIVRPGRRRKILV